MPASLHIGAASAQRPHVATDASFVKPHFTHLSATQVKERSSGARKPMIVVFDDQLSTLPDSASHRTAREAAAARMAAPLVSQLKQVGASKITALNLLNAVSATIPASEVSALRATVGVKEVVPDGNIIIGVSDPASSSDTVAAGRVRRAVIPDTASDGQAFCNSSPADPLLEPEALTNIHDASSNPNAQDEGSSLANGNGVIVGNVDADLLDGNANMIRPNGKHVIIDASNEDQNTFSDEFNGDVSTIAAQGTVTYTYRSQLPYSKISSKCTFRIVGDAPGASIVTTGYFTDTNSQGQVVAPESQVIAGLQTAVNDGVNVVSESYGYGALPGATDDLLEPANDAMVKAGVVVVESAGDSGSSGTVEAPADDPNVIDVGGTNDLRLLAQAYGYTKGWEDNNMTTLSSGGTAPDGRVVDLVAPGYTSFAAVGAGNDPALPTEAFGGTSQAAPFVSGAAADVIEAYRKSHAGATPSPAQVKAILTSTATDIGAASDQQGAGLLNVYAAIKAAKQMPGTTVKTSTLPEVVADPTQVDVTGTPGSTVTSSVSLYNASSRPETVTGTYRALGAEKVLDPAVTENVSAPPSSASVPAQGATAASPITFKVPKGVDVLDADMRWPDKTNNADNILTFILTDPAGKVAQMSYDYGASNGTAASPDIQHSTVEHPMAGTWTAQIVWNNGRAHLQEPPSVPGSYRGTVTFRASGQTFSTAPASKPVTIAARSTAKVPLHITMPSTPGDQPESVQFTGADGLASSVPVARRVLIPSSGGKFTADLTSSVSRGPGQIQTFFVDVPKGEHDIDVTLNAQDHAADDQVYYYLFSPDSLAPSIPESGNVDVSATDVTPTPANRSGRASLISPDPQPGVWEIAVMQAATTNGAMFVNHVTGTVAYNQLKPVTVTGLPDSSATTVDSGSSTTITVHVTNTTNHIGLFGLEPTNNDITGGNVMSSTGAGSPVELQPGASGELTATLSPTAPTGTAVTGTLSVVDSTDWTALEPTVGFAASASPFANLPYAYTVGSAAG